MTPAELRELIRTTLDCRCPAEYRIRVEHLPNCEWIAAVLKIYELERKA